MYTLVKNETTGQITSVRIVNGDNVTTIPFDPANVDFQQFKIQVLAGAELQDADGNLMTAEQAKAYVATLP